MDCVIEGAIEELFEKPVLAIRSSKVTFEMSLRPLLLPRLLPKRDEEFDEPLPLLVNKVGSGSDVLRVGGGSETPSVGFGAATFKLPD